MMKNLKLYGGIVAATFALAGGIAHVLPSQLANVVGYNLFGFVTVQVLAGLGGIYVSVLYLAENLKKG